MNETQGKRKCWCHADLGPSAHEMYGTCKKCGTQVLLRQLSRNDLDAFYKDSYWTTFMKDNYKKPQIHDRAVNDFYDRIPFYYETLTKYIAEPASVLEIGCSHGGFLYYCKQHAIPRTIGIEVDKTVCQLAQNLFGLHDIIPGMFPDVSLPLESFDAIVSFDVLEHFLDPVQTLKAVYDRLSSKGICFFVTPAYRGEDKDWDRFRIDEHIYLYNEVNVSQLFQKADIEIIDIFPSLYNQDMMIIGRRKKDVISSHLIPYNIAIPLHEYGPYGDQKLLINEEKKKLRKKEELSLISVLFIIEKNDDLWEKSLYSILHQVYSPIEIIIVGDLEFRNSYNPDNIDLDNMPIKLLTFSAGEPLSVRLNQGINVAQGNYIAFLTSHSAFYSNHLLALYQTLESQRCDAVYSDTYRAGQVLNKNTFTTVKRDLIFANPCTIEKLNHEPLFPIFCTLLTKTSIITNGGFAENFDICCDWEFWIRYVKDNIIEKVTKITNEYFYRNDGSLITNAMRIQFHNERQQILEKYNPLNQQSKDYTYTQENGLLIDRRPHHPFPQIHVFMDTIIAFVEQKRVPEAIQYYKKYRTFLPPIPELRKFDPIINSVMKE